MTLGSESLLSCQGWLSVGNSQRATAATGMNEKSSRSHSIFSVILSQTNNEVKYPTSSLNLVACSLLPIFGSQMSAFEERKCAILQDNAGLSRRSKINLVDLAGSERLSQTCASGDRLRVSKLVLKFHRSSFFTA